MHVFTSRAPIDRIGLDEDPNKPDANVAQDFSPASQTKGCEIDYSTFQPRTTWISRLLALSKAGNI